MLYKPAPDMHPPGPIGDRARRASRSLAGGLCVAGAVWAQDPLPDDSPPREWFGGPDWSEWERATGDWGGIRTDLEQVGIELGGLYVFDWSYNASGGLRTGGTYRHLLEANLLLDLDPLLGLPDTRFYTSFVSQNGDNASEELVGDLQFFDNIDNADFDTIYDLWVETLPAEGLRIKVGKMDANTEFAVLDEGLVFLHSTPGFPPTVVAFPTYPDPAFGAVVFVTADSGLYAGAGIFDGALQDGVATGRRGPSTVFSGDASGAFFAVGETGYRWAGGRSGPRGHRWGAGHFAAGAWFASAEFDRFGGGTEDGTAGYYLLAEQQVWAEPGPAGEFQGVALLASYGEADERLWEFERSVMFGTTYTGLIPGRDTDVAGALLSYADLSDDPAAGFPEDEIAYELYYRLNLTPALSLQPVLSYIVNPSGQRNLDDALVGTLRGVIAF